MKHTVLFVLFISLPSQKLEGCASSSENTSTGLKYVTRPFNKEEIKINYIMGGTGINSIVLLHDLGLSTNIWPTVYLALKNSYRVILVDLRGHGDSGKPHYGYTLDEFAQDVYTVILSLSLSKPILLGWSLGGLVAMRYAQKYPHMLSGLILVGTTPQYISDDSFLFGVSAQHLEEASQALKQDSNKYYCTYLNSILPKSKRKTPTDIVARSLLKSILSQNDPDALAAILNYFAKKKPSCVRDLSSISVPTLIIAGGLDQIIPVSASFFLYHKIPDTELYLIPSGDHALPLTHSKEFIRAVEAFIEGSLLNPTNNVYLRCTSI